MRCWMQPLRQHWQQQQQPPLRLRLQHGLERASSHSWRYSNSILLMSYEYYQVKLFPIVQMMNDDDEWFRWNSNQIVLGSIVVYVVELQHHFVADVAVLKAAVIADSVDLCCYSVVVEKSLGLDLRLMMPMKKILYDDCYVAFLPASISLFDCWTRPVRYHTPISITTINITHRHIDRNRKGNWRCLDWDRILADNYQIDNIICASTLIRKILATKILLKINEK